MRLLPPQARTSGEILLARPNGTGGVAATGNSATADIVDEQQQKATPIDLLQTSEDRVRQLRGSEISMIFQEPMTALNPVMRVGDQIAEAVLAHSNGHRISKHDAWNRAVEAMKNVAIPDPERR